MSNLAAIRSKLEFIASLTREAGDSIHSHYSFLYSNPHIELLVADVVKHVGTAVVDKLASHAALELSKVMAAQAGATPVDAWDPDAEICLPWRVFPWPRPFSEIAIAHRDPWESISSAEQIELAHILTNLAGLTESEEFCASLKALAALIARLAAAEVARDFERCGTKPRVPFPLRPRYVEAKAAG